MKDHHSNIVDNLDSLEAGQKIVAGAVFEERDIMVVLVEGLHPLFRDKATSRPMRPLKKTESMQWDPREVLAMQLQEQ